MKLRSGKTFVAPPPVPRPAGIRRPAAPRPTRVVKKPLLSFRSPDPKGLNNPGCFCYRRALLQCLLNVPKPYDYVKPVHSGCELPLRECLYCAFRDLARQYFDTTEDDAARAARLLRRAVGRFDRAFAHDWHHGCGIDEDFLTHDEEGDPPEFWSGLVNLLGERAGNAREITRHSDTFVPTWENRWTCVDCGYNGVIPGHNPWLYCGIAHPTRGLPFQQYFDTMFNTSTPDHRCGDCVDRLRDEQLAELDGAVDQLDPMEFFEARATKERQQIMSAVQEPEILVIQFARFNRLGGVGS